MNEETITQPVEIVEDVQEEQSVAEENQTVSNEEVQAFLKVKFNKEEKDLSLDEAREYAQKGMNYDHVKSELDTLKQDKGLSYLDSLAKKNDMTREELVSYFEEQEKLNEVKEMASQHGIEDDDFAKTVYDLKKKAEAWDKRIQEDETKSQAEARKAKENDELLSYFKEINGRDADIQKDIPSEIFVIAERDQVSLKTAYAMYEIRRMRELQAIQEKNEENASSSTGSVSSNGSTKELVFTEDSISKMSEKEMAKHWTNPLFRKVAGLDKKRKDD